MLVLLSKKIIAIISIIIVIIPHRKSRRIAFLYRLYEEASKKENDGDISQSTFFNHQAQITHYILCVHENQTTPTLLTILYI